MFQRCVETILDKNHIFPSPNFDGKLLTQPVDQDLSEKLKAEEVDLTKVGSFPRETGGVE